MPTFKVEAPNGHILDIEAPEGASQDEILKFARDVAYPQYLQSIKPPEQEKSSALRQAADIPLNVAQGAVSGVRMIADAFGADSETSKSIRGVENYLGGLMSAQAKRDQKEISRIMQEAEKQGVGDQVLAGLKALAVAPAKTLANAAGTMVPVIASSLAAEVLGPAAAVASGLGVGGAMGAGTVKGAIYDNVKQAFIESGADPKVAEERAIKAQEYGGENLDMILGGAALGGLEATTGVQPAIKAMVARKLGREVAAEAAKKEVGRDLAGRVGIGALHEAPLEAAQGAQEQYAGNVAQAREGFNVEPMAGVVAHGVLEGTAGGILGGAVEGAIGKRREAGPTRPDLGGLKEDIETSRKATTEDLENILSGRAKGSPPPLALPAPEGGIAGLLPAPSAANRPTGPGGPGMYALNEGNPIVARDQVYRGEQMGPYAEGQAPANFVSGFLPAPERVPTTLALPAPSGAAPSGPSPAQYGATMQNMARQEVLNTPVVTPPQAGQYPNPNYGPPTMAQMINMRLPNGGIMSLPAPKRMLGLPAPSGVESAPTAAQYAATIQQQQQRESQSIPLSQLPKATLTEEEMFGPKRPSFDLGYQPSIEELFPAPKKKEEATGPSESEKLFGGQKPVFKGPPPTTLSQFVRRFGGINTAGTKDFSGRDLNKRGMNLIGRRNGISLEYAVMRAIDAGYYPEFAAQLGVHGSGHEGLHVGDGKVTSKPTSEMIERFKSDLEQDALTDKKIITEDDRLRLEDYARQDNALFQDVENAQREQWRNGAEQQVHEEIFNNDPEAIANLDETQKKIVERTIDKMEEARSSDHEPSITKLWDEAASEIEYSKAGKKIARQKAMTSEQAKPEPVTTVTEEERNAAKARVNARLQEIRDMGPQGVELAAALEKALADHSIDAEKIVSAFEMAHTVGRLLSGLSNTQKLTFAKTLMAGADEVGGIRRKSDLGGLIELSLNPEYAIGTATAAHEAFHVLQDVFAQNDKAAGKIINDAFKNAKTIDDVSPAILRILKNTRSPIDASMSLYDQFKQIAPDSLFENMPQAQRERELQAYTFGFLDHARMNGIQVGTMGSAFTRFMNFLRSFRESMGNYLRGRGFNTVEDIFEGVTRGEQQQGLAGPVSTSEGIEKSQAKLPPEYSKATGIAQSQTNSEKYFSVWDKVREFFDPFHTVDQFNILSAFRNRLFGKIDISHSNAKRLSEIISKGTKVQQDEVYKYLTTKDASQSMVSDPTLRAAAVEVKQAINETAKQMVKEGILSQESMDKYYDRYLPRMYVYYEMTNRGIKSPNMGISPQEYLKKRNEDLTVDERKMLGEITNPAYLAYVAIARPAKDIAMSQYFTQIMNQSGTKWILPNSVVEVQGQKVTPYWLKSEAIMLENTVLPTLDKTDVALIAKMKNRIAEMKQIADQAINESNPVINKNEVPDGYRVLPDSARYGVLRGAVIQKGIYDDIVGTFVQIPTNDKPWLQALMGDERSTIVKANQLWKMGKVTLNVPSQVRNVISNAIALNVFGGVPLIKMAPRILTAINEMTSDGKVYQEAKEWGIGGGTMSGAELNTARARLESYLRQNNNGENIHGAFAAARIMAQSFIGKTSELYQTTEVIFKLAAYMQAREEGKSPSEAVNHANDALFDYTRVNPNIRYIRNSPIGLPFITYLYKVVPKTIQTAVENPMRFAPYVALFYAIPAMAISALGIDDDDYEAMKKSLPEYIRNKGSLYIMPYRGEKGEIKYADLGYFFPWATFVDPLIQMGRGDVMGGGKDLLRNFTPSGPIVTALTALTTNKDSFTGRDIVDPRQTPENKALAMLSYVWNQALPPMLGMDFANPEKSGGVLPRLYNDAFGSGTGMKANGQPKPEFLEDAGRLLGLNIDTANPVMSRAQNILHMQSQIHASEALRAQIAKDQSLTIEKRRSEIAALNEKIRNDYREIQKYAQETARAPAAMKKGT